ncbi:hypothetical protein MBLNU13_g04076t1 [Cladosporium sp. NU13]
MRISSCNSDTCFSLHAFVWFYVSRTLCLGSWARSPSYTHQQTTIAHKTVLAMARANDHTESTCIRNILEIGAFNLATLEYELIRNAYVPASTDERKIRDATYRFYTASNIQPPRFYI